MASVRVLLTAALVVVMVGVGTANFNLYLTQAEVKRILGKLTCKITQSHFYQASLAASSMEALRCNVA